MFFSFPPLGNVSALEPIAIMHVSSTHSGADIPVSFGYTVSILGTWTLLMHDYDIVQLLGLQIYL